MSAQAWFSQQEVEVAPGLTTAIQLTVANLADRTDSFSIVPSGLAAGWTSIRPASVTLFGGSTETVTVEVTPPPVHTTTAGPTALTVRVVPQSAPDDVAATEVILEVAPFFDRRLTLLQPALRSRRGATFELMFDNQSNAPASCRLRVAEGMNLVDADFNPPALGAEPGASSLVKVRVKAKGVQWERRSRTLPFVLEAEQPGTPPTTVAGTLVQTPVLPERMFGRLAAAAAALGALALAWVSVVRPEIRRSVDDRVATVTVSTIVGSVSGTTIPGQPAPSTTPPSTTPVVASNLKGASARLQPGAAVQETKSQAFAAPADADFLLTDWILQNPDGDTGTARLLRGADVLYEWDLATVQLDLLGAYVTPIEVAAGGDLSLQVTCLTAGDGSGVCTTAMTVSGQLRPRDG